MCTAFTEVVDIAADDKSSYKINVPSNKLPSSTSSITYI